MRVKRLYPGTWRLNEISVEKLMGFTLGLAFAMLLALGWVAYDITQENQKLQAEVSQAKEQRDFWRDAALKITGGKKELDLAIIALERLNRALRQDADAIEAHRGRVEDLPDGP